MFLLIFIILLINCYIFFKLNYNLLITLVEQYHYYIERDSVKDKWNKFVYLVQFNELKKILNLSKFKKKSHDEYQHKKEYSKSLREIEKENHLLLIKDLNIIKKYKALILDESSLKCTNNNKIQLIVDFCKENNVLLLVINDEKFDSINIKNIEQNKYLSPHNYKRGYLGVYRLNYNDESEEKEDVDIKRYLYDFKKQYNLKDEEICYLSNNCIENYKKINITF